MVEALRGTADGEGVVSEACVIDQCVKPRLSRGWCSMHYFRWLRHGDPLTVFRTV